MCHHRIFLLGVGCSPLCLSFLVGGCARGDGALVVRPSVFGEDDGGGRERGVTGGREVGGISPDFLLVLGWGGGDKRGSESLAPLALQKERIGNGSPRCGRRRRRPRENKEEMTEKKKNKEGGWWSFFARSKGDWSMLLLLLQTRGSKPATLLQWGDGLALRVTRRRLL